MLELITILSGIEDIQKEFWITLFSILGVVGTGLAGWLTTTIVGWLNQKIKDKKLARCIR